MSDRSRISYGRRRPFILGGMLATILTTTILAWITPISSSLGKLFGINSSNEARAAITQCATIITVVLLYIAIQPLQLGLRSLSLDVCPPEQQPIASAWASRSAGVGNIIGYVLGSLRLAPFSSSYEAWNFRYMIYFTTITIFVTSLITCYFVEEETPQTPSQEKEIYRPSLETLEYIREGFSAMSPRTRRVCNIQFFSWMGWSGFLFYSTSFISQLYINDQPTIDTEMESTLWSEGTRIGSTASLLFAIVALGTSIVLPKLLTVLASNSLLFGGYSKPWHLTFSKIHIVWGIGQLIYVISLLSTFLISSRTAGTYMVSISGLSWGITQWVPFAMIGEEAAGRQIESDIGFEEDDKKRSVSQAGSIVGMHNAAISAPQIIAALASSTIFWVAHKLDLENPIEWVFRCSSLPAATAAWLAFTM